DQRERGVGDRVEQVERLKRSQVLCRRDDEARDRRAATEAEVGRDAPERERGSTLLWRYQGDEQRLVRGAGRAEPGTADDRASERLPRPVDERKAGIAERARKIAGDQDRLGGESDRAGFPREVSRGWPCPGSWQAPNRRWPSRSRGSGAGR